MGEESVHLPSDNLEYHVVTLFEKIEALRRNSNSCTSPNFWRLSVRTEIRTLEFWRSVICECIASFCYVFIVCGAGAAAGTGAGASTASVLFSTAFATGLSMTTLTQCFGQKSGAHINPAVTIAMVVTKNISLIRALTFIVAQCGGGVAGAAFVYGTTVPGYQSTLPIVTMSNVNVMAWERFGVEFVLSFIVVLTHLVTMTHYNQWLGSSAALTVGSAYASCTLVTMPYLNPARSLGPSFVLSKWDNHWVYWVGPLTGGIIAGLVYEYVLNPRRRQKRAKESPDADSLSIQSEEDPYDDLEKPPTSKYNSSSYNYRQASNTVVTSSSGYCPSLMSSSLYSAPPCKLERVESLYGGTKSLYCKSPPLTRANLNRSQSVYTKSNHGVNRDGFPRPGPLVPAQSLYPMRLNQQQSHVQNQNVQNQMQQRSENNFGTRGIASGASRPDGYGGINTGTGASAVTHSPKYEDGQKFPRTNRPESMYGMTTSHPHHGQSEDSTYSSYYGNSKRSNPNSNGNVTYQTVASSTMATKTSPGTNAISSTSSSFHHAIPQHSTTMQY